MGTFVDLFLRQIFHSVELKTCGGRGLFLVPVLDGFVVRTRVAHLLQARFEVFESTRALFDVPPVRLVAGELCWTLGTGKHFAAMVNVVVIQIPYTNTLYLMISFSTDLRIHLCSIH